MNIVVDNNLTSWRSSHVENAMTLFEREVPVRLRAPDKEERIESLVIRILLGVHKAMHGAKTLRIQLTSEDDPYFLHTLEVSEEDFANLKADQGILVDFSAFPTKLIELLESCTRDAPATAAAAQQGGTEETESRFSCRLTLRGADSVFAIIETNKFKHLSHIALSFRPGNDAAIKQYLASRLFEIRDERSKLTTNLRATTSLLEKTRMERDTNAASLTEERAAHVRDVSELKSSTSMQLAEAKERAMAEQSALQNRLEAERAEVVRRAREQEDALQQRVHELEKGNKQLQETKFALDARVSELSAKLGSAEGELKAARDDVMRLRTAAEKSDASAHEATRHGTEQSVRVQALEQQLQDKTALVDTMRARLEEAEAVRRAADESVGETRRTLHTAEERLQATAAEVAKGNAIIERLQNELRSTKAKTKLKAAVIAQQEQLLAERQADVNRAATEARRAMEAAEAARAEADALRTRAEEQKRKLEEAQTVLQSNQQMIQWLNNQVTEAQMGKYAGGTMAGAASAAGLGGAGRSVASKYLPGGGGKSSDAAPLMPSSRTANMAMAGTSGSYVPGKYAAAALARGGGGGGGASGAAPVPLPTPSAFMPSKTEAP